MKVNFRSISKPNRTVTHESRDGRIMIGTFIRYRPTLRECWAMFRYGATFIVYHDPNEIFIAETYHNGHSIGLRKGKQS